MDRNLQIWLIVVFLNLFGAIFLIGIFLRLLWLLRTKPGQHDFQEIAEWAFEPIDGADRVMRTTVAILDEFKAVVEQAASVSRRQLSHVDRVVGDVLTGVSRIQRDVSLARNWPIRVARPWSPGVTPATIAFFRMNGTADKGKRW